MNIQLDRTSPKSLSSQIADQIREMIHSHVFPDGGRIPSTRLLSKELSINRITVSHAYNRLISEGLLRTGVGSGTYVQVNILGNKGESKDKLDRSNLGPIFSKAAASIQQAHLAAPILDDASPGMINFATLIPDERFFPVDAFKDCLVEVMDREGSKVLQYCGTLGYPPLREYLAERMRESGIEVDWDGILVVNGAQQGIDLVLRCFLSPGEKVALGVPTYHNVFPIIKLLMAKAAPVPMTDQGLDLDGLRAVLSESSVRLLYTMPNFQNPTGITCDAERRRAIYELAKEKNIPILEDDFERDLSLEKSDLLPIKALDRKDLVVYLSTFSKSLFPGLRIGWLVASEETMEVLALIKKTTDLENSALLQAAAHTFFRRGLYEEHLQKIRGLIRERMGAAFEVLEENMPEEVSWSRPQGGYVVWIGHPRGVPSERVFALAKNRGVLVTPGTLFDHAGADPGGIRLSLSRTGPGDIEKGIRILADVIKEELGSGRRAGASAQQAPQHL